MLVVLRALTLMDTSPVRVIWLWKKQFNMNNMIDLHLQEASITRNRTKNEIVARVSIKRKVGYSDDEVTEARKRMNQMHLD